MSQPISRVLSRTIIHLGHLSPNASINLPEPSAGNALKGSYMVLLQVGFTLPSLFPVTRCALTAPFHPYQHAGGIFSVALAIDSRRPGVTWHPALWSPDFPPKPNGKSDCPAGSLSILYLHADR